MTFVKKFLSKNVDEIDTRMPLIFKVLVNFKISEKHNFNLKMLGLICTFVIKVFVLPILGLML